jgi:hypothetical protein
MADYWRRVGRVIVSSHTLPRAGESRRRENMSVKRGFTDIVAISEAEVRLVARTWNFPQDNAVAIDAYWHLRSAQQPKLFNGDILLLDGWSLSEGTFQGTCLTTDYKSFLYWREHNAPDRGVINFFAAAVLHSREGWLVLAQMGPDHSSSGLIFPPCGSLHTEDVKEGRVDLDANILREIKEETGFVLSKEDLKQPFLILDGTRLAYMRLIELPWSAAEIVHRIEGYLAAEKEPEISKIHVVKGREDIIESAMPTFTVSYIEHAFR